MSQRKRASNTQSSQNKGVRRWEAVLGDDEDDPSFTQPSTSQVQKGLDRLTPAQVDLKTAEVVQFIFVKDQKKFPIRRADIVKHVVKEYRNVYPEIIKRVGRVFETVFGLKLVEIDSKNHVYILINKLEQQEGEPLNMSPSNPKTGLLFVILSIVFMKGGVVKENMVWNTLKKLRVDQGERHDIFGDVKKVVTDEFVRQRYLEYVRIPHTDPLEFEFRWGQRADMEVSKVKLLEFIGQFLFVGWEQQNGVMVRLAERRAENSLVCITEVGITVVQDFTSPGGTFDMLVNCALDFEKTRTSYSAKIFGFSWENCGKPDDPAVLKTLTLSPDPITVPGELTASASGNTIVEMAAPLAVNVTLEKEVAGFWVKVPCVEEIGSCHYTDGCDLLNQLIPPGQDCPEPLHSYGIPCHCPFKAGLYTLPESDFYLPDIDLPYWLTNGHYRVQGVLGAMGKELGCLKITFAVHSNN